MKLHFEALIVFENDDYILINKPPGVASLDERTSDRSGQSVLRLAKAYCADAQLGHRLDKDTSGILAIAKNPDAYRHIAMQFEHREVIKRYHAITNGVHNLEGISVYLPISPLKDRTAVRIDREGGKVAETIFNTIQAYRNTTLVECMPITGRMHQIRVHLMCLKAPIVNDVTYGGKPVFLSDVKRKFNLKQGTEELPLIGRVALHAHSLTFAQLDGAGQTFVAPYPKDFGTLVKQLEKFN